MLGAENDEADLITAMLDAIDIGVVMTASDFETVLAANQTASTMLAALGAAPGRVPAVVRQVLAAESVADLPTERLSPPGTAVGRPGVAVCVRGRRLPADPSRGVLVLTPAVQRHSEIAVRLATLHGLSRRQAECAALVCAGLRNREIGARLGISVGRVEQYLVEVYDLLKVSCRTALVAGIQRLLAWPEAPEPRPDPKP